MVIGAAVCGRIPGLAKSQREQCRKAPHAMPAVGEGAELGLRECRHQFRHHRWNCSHVANDQVFGHVVVVGKDCPVTAACPLFIIPWRAARVQRALKGRATGNGCEYLRYFERSAALDVCWIQGELLALIVLIISFAKISYATKPDIASVFTERVFVLVELAIILRWKNA